MGNEPKQLNQHDGEGASPTQFVFDKSQIHLAPRPGESKITLPEKRGPLTVNGLIILNEEQNSPETKAQEAALKARSPFHDIVMEEIYGPAVVPRKPELDKQTTEFSKLNVPKQNATSNKENTPLVDNGSGEVSTAQVPSKWAARGESAKAIAGTIIGFTAPVLVPLGLVAAGVTLPLWGTVALTAGVIIGACGALTLGWNALAAGLGWKSAKQAKSDTVSQLKMDVINGAFYAVAAGVGGIIMKGAKAATGFAPGLWRSCSSAIGKSSDAIAMFSNKFLHVGKVSINHVTKPSVAAVKNSWYAFKKFLPWGAKPLGDISPTVFQGKSLMGRALGLGGTVMGGVVNTGQAVLQKMLPEKVYNCGANLFGHGVGIGEHIIGAGKGLWRSSANFMSIHVGLPLQNAIDTSPAYISKPLKGIIGLLKTPYELVKNRELKAFEEPYSNLFQRWLAGSGAGAAYMGGAGYASRVSAQQDVIADFNKDPSIYGLSKVERDVKLKIRLSKLGLTDEQIAEHSKKDFVTGAFAGALLRPTLWTHGSGSILSRMGKDFVGAVVPLSYRNSRVRRERDKDTIDRLAAYVGRDNAPLKIHHSTMENPILSAAFQTLIPRAIGATVIDPLGKVLVENAKVAKAGAIPEGVDSSKVSALQEADKRFKTSWSDIKSRLSQDTKGVAYKDKFMSVFEQEVELSRLKGMLELVAEDAGVSAIEAKRQLQQADSLIGEGSRANRLRKASRYYIEANGRSAQSSWQDSGKLGSELSARLGFKDLNSTLAAHNQETNVAGVKGILDTAKLKTLDVSNRTKLQLKAQLTTDKKRGAITLYEPYAEEQLRRLGLADEQVTDFKKLMQDGKTAFSKEIQSQMAAKQVDVLRQEINDLSRQLDILSSRAGVSAAEISSLRELLANRNSALVDLLKSTKEL